MANITVDAGYYLKGSFIHPKTNLKKDVMQDHVNEEENAITDVY